MPGLVHSLVGLAGLVAIAVLLSEDRRRVSWRLLAAGLGGQVLVAALLLKVPAAKAVFMGLNHLVEALQAATRAGTSFVFGYVGGGAPPFAVSNPAASFVLAFEALPLVLIMSALSALLYHWRILPLLVRAVARVLERAFGLGGAVGMSAAAMPFLGMIESPLLIRPYMGQLSRGELFVVMTGGMATIAGTVLVLYATFLAGVVPDAVGHLLTATLVSVPAAVMLARVMIPDECRTGGGKPIHAAYGGAMDAVVRGTLDGLQLLAAIVAMLVVLVALVSLANSGLALLPDMAGAPLSLQRAMGVALAPLAWLMGIPAGEMMTAGALMGTKLVLNELLAYLELARLPAEALSERSRIVMTYGLCGFANLGSLGIMIAGLAAMAPERRGEIVALGGKALVSGTLATSMTAAVVGLLL
ncbi:NupC/NupG family nucleoside CNT transporter [Magnetospirillum sp. UT-4]|uniref:NupC/NupG family nucleoside CNT transporter n=1 Tax=Magnetospirillum sp. UT-4 TaxID=2681467 RepID=UPI001382472A|nr:nucleoside transporter C-terminal domain-containing protein [Magnetospirillum sp. UT-4]CAA7621617.1 NupC family protein [Magnetospirillum sp. UT-4]